MSAVTIGLIGDHDPGVTAHRAIPLALELAGSRLGVAVSSEWIATDTLAGCVSAALAQCDGIWCVPASPYRSEAGALRGIRFARESRRPSWAVAGLQNAGWNTPKAFGSAAAAHAGTTRGSRAVIAPLSCEWWKPAAGSSGAVPPGVTYARRGGGGYHCPTG